MPSWAAMTPLGLEMLRELPGWIQEDPDLRAIVHCHAKETERQLTMLAAIRDDCIVLRATARGLEWWETYYGMTVAPVGWTVEQRRVAVLARITRDPPLSSGLSWQNQLNGLIGEGWTYEEDSAAFKIEMEIPYPPGSDTFKLVREQVPRFASWPCHLELVLSSVEGFVLDLSELDEEPFEGP